MAGLLFWWWWGVGGSLQRQEGDMANPRSLWEAGIEEAGNARGQDMQEILPERGITEHGEAGSWEGFCGKLCEGWWPCSLAPSNGGSNNILLPQFRTEKSIWVFVAAGGFIGLLLLLLFHRRLNKKKKELEIISGVNWLLKPRNLCPCLKIIHVFFSNPLSSPEILLAW
jgi:hypothetical protein